MRMRDDRGSAVYYGLAALLVYAPLIQAGILPRALMVLELAALVLAAWVFWRPDFKTHLSKSFLWSLCLLLALPLLQLLPVPPGLWQELPGRELYAQALRDVHGDSAFQGLRGITMVPFDTGRAWLSLLPPLLVFLAAVGLPTQRLTSLVVLMIGLAVFQAVLGLVQFGDGPDSVFRLGNPYYIHSAVGTYINRNHLAGFLEMALPMALALLATTVGAGGRTHRSNRHSTLRRRLAQLVTVRIDRAIFFGAAALGILLGLAFTRSRAGITLGMLGILLCTVAFSRRLGGKNVYGWMGSFVAIGVGLAALAGLAPVLARFADNDVVDDARWTIYAGTVKAIGEFFPLGSGGGTFFEIFHRFRPEGFWGKSAYYAHNEYLEWVLEYGVLVAVPLVIFLAFYLRQWGRVWRPGTWPEFTFLQVGAGFGLLSMVLHSIVDFNLRVPANAIFFALLAAVFFHRPAPPRTRERWRKESESRGLFGDAGVRKEQAPRTSGRNPAIPPENLANPFDD